MRARVCGLLLVATLILCGRSRAQSPPDMHQSVMMDLRAGNGAAALYVATFGAHYRLDSSKLWFDARRHGVRGATRHRLAARFGTPQETSPGGNGSLQQDTVAIDFGAPPDGPGMYDLYLHTEPGYALTDAGDALPFGDWGRAPTEWHEYLWWPDTSGDDASLERARASYVGKDVYAYGGSEIGCPPQWVNLYEDWGTAIPVRSIERDTGDVAELWPGSILHGGNDMALHFFAVSPLRMMVGMPAAKAQGSGGTSTAAVGGCPSVVLADWQLDVTFDSSPPPSTVPPYPGAKVTPGMSRDEIAWMLGYPNEFGDRATLRAQSVWVYNPDPRDNMRLGFTNDTFTAFR
jgi:hypothetical protein